MNQLETLLNTLIQMGWKPWGKYNKVLDVSRDRNGLMRMLNSNSEGRYTNIRSIVSLESGLWQFCEKNGLLHEYYNGRSNIHPYKCYWTTTYQYRLLESALVPEEDLAKFLLDNIKIEGK